MVRLFKKCKKKSNKKGLVYCKYHIPNIPTLHKNGSTCLVIKS